MSSTDTDLDPLLRRLHLANTRRVWRQLIARAEQEQWSYEQLLQTLIAEEVAHRRATRLNRAVHAARFPFLRTVEEFDPRRRDGHFAARKCPASRPRTPGSSEPLYPVLQTHIELCRSRCARSILVAGTT
jgi:hypothetical protein